MLRETEEMQDPNTNRLKKLIVFTEHRDTLDYLVNKLRNLFGQEEAVVDIHGGIKMERRRFVQERFTHDPDVVVLVATDAAGEGINLQSAHLMVNYDLPWNPNRIEQRFGRIHRIGQTEVCRMWNMVARGTREGEVFETLFDKLEAQRRALGGKVFDVLGEAFADTPLRDLLIQAITQENPQLEKMRLMSKIDDAVSKQTKEIIKRQSLLHNTSLDQAACEQLRDALDRAVGYRLQPSYVRRFFLEAFKEFGGNVTSCEENRYQVARVPQALIHKGGQYGCGQVQKSYERICFDRDAVVISGKPRAALLAPGHPLLDAVISGVCDRYDSLLLKGAVLVDPDDDGSDPRLLVFLEHEICDATTTPTGQPRVVSRRFEYVEVSPDGEPVDAGRHPYLDYRVPEPQEQVLLSELVKTQTRTGWLSRQMVDSIKQRALLSNARRHLDETSRRVEEQVDRTLAAVEERLTREINYQRDQAVEFSKRRHSGLAAQARRRAEEANERLTRRIEELNRQRKLRSGQLRELGLALVVPAGLLAQIKGAEPPERAQDTQRVERLAVDAVLDEERKLGRRPREMPHNNKGYDIETRSGNDPLLFIEVKGRVAGAEHFSITASEILFALNTAEQHILALVKVEEDSSTTVRYLPDPFTARQSEPGFGEHRRVLGWEDYWALASEPSEMID